MHGCCKIACYDVDQEEGFCDDGIKYRFALVFSFIPSLPISSYFTSDSTLLAVF